MSTIDISIEIDPGVKALVDEVLPGWLDADRQVIELTHKMLETSDSTEFNQLIEDARLACAARDGMEPGDVTDEMLARSIDSATWFISDREGYMNHQLAKAFDRL